MISGNTDFKQIKFSLSSDNWIIISSECIELGTLDSEVAKNYCGFYVTGISDVKDEHNHLTYKEEDAGFYNFQIEETIKYTIQVSNGLLLSELSDLGLKKIAENVFALQVVNFLGKASLSVYAQNTEKQIDFEIISNKIDYKKDYISLTEKIAHCCSQLLLDYSSAANLDFSYDSQSTQKSILEQFLFIREFCSEDNIDYILSTITNNPDRVLVADSELRPFGTAPISQKFYSNPFSNSKNWQYVDGKNKPCLISTSRKYDSFDTPANRFIKFALNNFLLVCETVILSSGNISSTFYQREAEALKSNIELALSNSFFDDVSDLDLIPINNQVLQKREGYKQIFNAFNMLDLALKLNWPGKEKVYENETKTEGEVKNTALLYEYWLFFELFYILKNLSEDISLKENDSEAFISTNNGNLLISLKEGNASKIGFKIKDSNLNVNLYYNKTFVSQDFTHLHPFSNSYSRDFRPDYTLEFYKGNLKDAKLNGQVSYVHFDAKYRLTDLSSWFTEETESVKKDEALNTYKRGDLLKMHTYNDAIRRTLGSYVLYPGSNANKQTQFSVYDEILPGVGAFAIKPSNKDLSESVLSKFITEIVKFQDDESSREKRIRFYENNIINYVGINENYVSVNPDNSCLIGFLRCDYYKWLKDNNILFNKPFYFYFHAIEDGNVLTMNPNIHKATHFCGYLTDPKESEDLILENWIAEIDSTQLISKAALKNKLIEIGYNPENRNHKLNADFYYLVEVKNLKEIITQPLKQSEFYKSNGNFAESKYSPFVCNISEITERG